MLISKLILKNWRNFRDVDVDLQERVFIVGPNASGKSNLLDAFRFLRDVSKTGGGLQEAVKNRGGVSKIRCLSAKGKRSDIEVSVIISDEGKESKPLWKYEVVFTQTGGGVIDTRAKIKHEKVFNYRTNKIVLQRPTKEDIEDEKLLEYTHLEQPGTNSSFRDVAEFFKAIEYLNILPQLLRDPSSFLRAGNKEDFYGRDFLEKINKNTRDSFIKKIGAALRNALPQFENLEFKKDDMGVPHLEASYKHWRGTGAKQREDQFSDGTLRFIALFWALQDGNKPLLLEEPELSLHSAIVSQLAEIIAKLQKKKTGKRQVILTTHSYDLLSNQGIDGAEVLMLTPNESGTTVINANSDEEIRDLLVTGLSVADTVLPKTIPKNISQLSLGI